MAALALVRTYHFQALWAEIEPLCEAGLIALACTAYKPVVAPAGAAAPFFGTNPLAFGWPRGERAPMVVDMATSAMARGEIEVAARGGEFVLALDPAACGDDANWRAHGEAFFARFAELAGAPRLPADRRHAARARTPAGGVEVPAALHTELERLAGGG